MEALTASLTFTKAVKKPLKYRKAAKPGHAPLSYYIHESADPMSIVTKIKGAVETTNVARTNDVVVTGPAKETYVMGPAKFLQLYNVAEEVAVPRQSPRMVAKVTRRHMKQAGIPGDRLEFRAPWGETMLLVAGDYLVRDNGSYYRIERAMFKQTYRLV
jgi:hypothetical protein